MKLSIIVTLVAVCLLISIAEPVFAKMGGEDMAGQQMGGRGNAFDMMNQGMGIRGNQGMHGLGFMHSAGNAFGEYVTFTIDDQTGDVLNYGVAGIPLFDIGITGFDYKSTTEAGSVTKVSDTDGSTVIQLHDNPAGVINILTKKETQITFTLADGVVSSKGDDFVRIESGSLVGYITGTGGTRITTMSGSETKVVVNASSNSGVVFRASPVNMPMLGNMGQRFCQEIARNRMGMEIAFGRNRTYNAINYSADMRVRVQEMEQNRIRMVINSDDPRGRLIAMNLDNSSLMIGARDRLRIHYDGMPLDCVNDPDMVFNGTDRPLCWISQVQDGGRAQLMLHVPDFSEHTIEIIVEPEEDMVDEMENGAKDAENMTEVPETTETADAQGVPGFGIVASLIGLLGWGYLGRKRE